MRGLGTVTAVGIVDRRSIYRHGLAHALRSGEMCVVEAAWLEGLSVSDFDVLFVEASVVLEAVVRSCVERPKVVAIVSTSDPRANGELLAAGAHAIISPDSSDAAVCAVAELVLQGMSAIPTSTCEWLAQGGGSDHAVTAEERIWLEELCSGATVTHVASKAGRSERSMYRDLHALYERLGVGGRYEALEKVRQLEF